MDFEDIALSEIGQKEKDRCALFQLCLETHTYTQNEQTKMKINSSIQRSEEQLPGVCEMCGGNQLYGD